MREVGCPAPSILLDTFHINILERSWTEPFQRVMSARRVRYVHLGDNIRRPPGRGLMDSFAIVATLRQIGYNGYLSAALLEQPDPDTAALDTRTYVRPLIYR